MTQEKVKIICHKPVDYVSPPHVYTVTKGTGKSDYHFWDEKRNCGTYMRPWLYKRAVENGALEEII